MYVMYPLLPCVHPCTKYFAFFLFKFSGVIDYNLLTEMQ